MRVKLFRWKAVVPLGIALVLVALLWWLLADVLAEHAVEDLGAELVGAKVDLESARIRLGQGDITLNGLAVTNPQRPMENLFEAEAIVANIAWAPLLARKVVVETLAVRGMQFGTPRETSGALPDRGGRPGLIQQQLNEWSERTRVPELSLRGLTGSIDLENLSWDSLQSVARVRSLASRTDTLAGVWNNRIRSLDPVPRIDSARALVNRLEGANVRNLGLAQVRGHVSSLRSTISSVDNLLTELNRVDANIRSDVGSLRSSLRDLSQVRNADLAFALRQLDLPSLDTPDLSASIFGEMVKARLRPLLYWVNLAAEHMPPGLDPRRRVGPKRPRRSGTDVEFPEEQSYPKFLMEFAEISLALAGEGAASGEYSLLATGLTTQPTVYGKPARFQARRESGTGPRTINAFGVLDHVGRPATDSVEVSLEGISLPVVDLAALGARLDLGQGISSLSLTRRGDSLAGRLRWRSPDAAWSRLGPDRTGSQASARVTDLLWRTLSSINDVEIETRFSGTITSPRIAVSSNIGRQLARALRSQLGEEVNRLEGRLRSEIDRRLEEPLAQARRRAAEVEARALGEVDGYRNSLNEVKAQLERRLRQLTAGIPGIG